MDNFRNELRDAFEKEQAPLADVSGASRRIVRSAMATRGGNATREFTHRRLQWAAGVAAVVLTAIVLGSFALVRAGALSHDVPSTHSSPRASVSPTPLARELGVPDATPVILYHDPADFGQIDGLTWDGKQSGKVSGAPGAGYGTNPASNLFGTSTQILDRHGNVVAAGTYGAKSFQATWADDGTRYCQMTPFDYLGANGVPATLQIAAPGQSPRKVAQVGQVYEQSSIGVFACSPQSDRAVVVQSAGQGVGTAQYWVVKLSTGKVLWTHNFQDTSGLPIQVVSSRDGMYVAEVQAALTGLITTFTSAIYGPAGGHITTLAGSVSAFSWDETLAVTEPGSGSGPVRVVRVIDGSVVWSGPAGIGFSVAQSVPEPGGGSLAIGITNPAQPTQSGSQQTAGFTPVDLYVIAPDGHVVKQMTDVYWG